MKLIFSLLLILTFAVLGTVAITSYNWTLAKQGKLQIGVGGGPPAILATSSRTPACFSEDLIILAR